MRKLRIGFISNCPVGGKTGLGRNMKAITPPLYRTNKYEIFFLAQGMNDNDSNFQRLPFKCEGVFRNVDQNRFNQDEGYRRFVAYGNAAVEEFVLKNKLDCLVLSDDAWAFNNEAYLNTDWFKHMASNILPVITADSEPLLPQIIEWAEKCPNMRFWSKFAERILKKKDPEKFKHCDVIYGGLNINEFYPIKREERLQLRKNFNIKDDEKVIIYLGRNQLRKIFGSHLEGLALFKKKYPEKKLKLLFHTFFGEPGGWPLNLIREQNGLAKEDLLATYFCRNCQDWNVQPYEGEELDCPHCNAKRTRITAGVGSTIDETDLNKIYNICDGSASIFTSGSFEFTNPESMLAGIPLAVPKYACGEDFIASDVVYEIKGTYTFEHATGFKKFVPDIESVCEFFNYIYDLPENIRKEISEKGRKWAIEQFDANKIAKQYEKFFDSCQPIEWDSFIEKKKELKNINAQVEDKSTDDEFVMECYSKILNMTPPPEDEGRKHWNKFLSQPRDKNQLKQEMINCFRSAGFQHNAKVQPNTIENLLNKEDKSRVLLALKESLGDAYILTSLLPEIKKKYPESSIYIGCDPKYFEVFENNEYIESCLPWTPEMDSELIITGQGTNKGLFNYYHNVGIGTQKLLNYLNSKYE